MSQLDKDVELYEVVQAIIRSSGVCRMHSEQRVEREAEYSTELMCPGTLGKHAVGYYDSVEVINHNSGNSSDSGIEELARRLELTEESL